MDKSAQIQALEERVADLLAGQPDHFLVDIRIKPTNNIKIYIDGDQGVSIENLVQYNRRLYRRLEEEGFYPDGDFSLEISSPGLDEPLKMHRQYLKNVGRFVEITDLEGNKKEGKLLQADENGIVVEETKGKGKKQEIIRHEIPFTAIKATRVLVKF